METTPNAVARTREPAGADHRSRIESVVEWIKHAHRMAGDGGISKGYHLLRRRWYPSYPETTGYTIPSLLNAAVRLGRPDLTVLAVELADYLLRSASAEGGVGHWSGANSGPIVFDTGQAVFGWLAAYRAARDERYLRAATEAGNWLVRAQDPSGAWVRGQYLGVTKVIDTRVAWAMLELHELAGDPRYRSAAVANLNWALLQQDQDGWFRRCSLVDGEVPLTHTLAYTAEGLYESGMLLGDEGMVEASRRTADALLSRVRDDGWLSSTYASGWRRTSWSSCLTGDCQLATLWLSYYRKGGDPRYMEAARRVLSFVKARQRLDGSNRHIRGAIPGSAPVFGRYERFKYPNWAAKFYLDALLALDSALFLHEDPVYSG
jgi:uncharacterized protein YyaL (SSP411 family)